MSIETLTDVERRLMESAVKGEPLELGDTVPPSETDPARDIDGALLAALIAGGRPGGPVPVGVSVQGARIVGPLDLRFATVQCPVELVNCRFTDEIILLFAHTKSFSLRDSAIKGITGDGLRVDGDLRLDNVDATEECRFPSARIDGDFVCDKARFKFNQGQAALVCDGITVRGTVHLCMAAVSGGARFLGAKIGGQFACDNAKFELKPTAEQGPDPDKTAIRLRGPSALLCDGMTVSGEVFLRQATVSGEASFFNVKFDGHFNCVGAQFKSTVAGALFCDRSTVAGSLLLVDAVVTGDASFFGSRIGGDFNCVKAKFEARETKALNFDSMTVRRNLVDVLKNYVAKLPKLTCDDMTVTGSVRLNQAVFTRYYASFRKAKVGHDFDCSEARFEKMTFLTGIQLTVDGVFRWEPEEASHAFINLHSAKIAVLEDKLKAWPEGLTILDGFLYERFGFSAPTDAETRIEWLNRQHREYLEAHFCPQPWQQLYEVLRREGHEVEAKKVAIEKERVFRKSRRPGLWKRLWDTVLEVTVGYGYRPERSLWPIIVLIGLGWAMFGLAYWQGDMRPSKEFVYLHSNYVPCMSERHPGLTYSERLDRCLPKEYPRFSSLIYSVDAFFPIVDLHQESYWLPQASAAYGMAFKIYLWVHILLGWCFTTLAVLAFTGIVKRE